MFRISQSVALLFFFLTVLVADVYAQPNIQVDAVQFDDLLFKGPPTTGGLETFFFTVDVGELLTVENVENAIFVERRVITLKEVPLGDSFLGFAQLEGLPPNSFGWLEIRRHDEADVRASFETLSSAVSYHTYIPPGPFIPPHPIVVGLPEPSAANSALISLCVLAAFRRRRRRQ